MSGDPRFMTIIQRRDVIKAVRERYSNQYGTYPDDYNLYSGRTIGETKNKLAALNLDSCTASDVDRAIGTKGWASNECDECGKDVAVLMRVGEEPDYEARNWELCSSCLTWAKNIMDGTEPIR